MYMTNNVRCEPVAQLVEQYTFNVWVDGSIPSGLTTSIFYEALTPPHFLGHVFVLMESCFLNFYTHLNQLKEDKATQDSDEKDEY